MDVIETRSQEPWLLIPAVAPLYASLSRIAYPLMRFVVGSFLVLHGGQKFFGWFGGNINGTAALFSKVGLEPAMPLVYVVATIEFVGGLCIALGFLTRF